MAIPKSPSLPSAATAFLTLSASASAMPLAVGHTTLPIITRQLIDVSGVNTKAANL